ncbi:hypothetical protein [Enterovibrio paralichthyis]|uniref:hypothetical protein n=1 Tax=Enterovibrio paralichthyis TaxID=2853805 RepID=UPI001C467C0E|nr:hypothetical protein [Enterovibrio paralichthyis]MBV7300234.1 hypothetical protein [Enterovibrio paralichthyis]
MTINRYEPVVEGDMGDVLEGEMRRRKHGSWVKLSDHQKKVADLEAKIQRLNAESDRLTNALDYVLESGSISGFDAVQKARWGLGLEVENEAEIAALKPRYSN